jgi:hypothetical protein
MTVDRKTLCELKLLYSYHRFCDDVDEQILTIHLRNTENQPDNNDLCGYYAIAYAVAICSGNDPTLLRFDPHGLITYVRNGLCNGRFDSTLPASLTCNSLDLRVIREQKLHCLCQRPYVRGHIVSCAVYNNHYHARCVSVHDMSTPLFWQGPCCTGCVPQLTHFVPDPQDEELVATSFDYDTNSAVNAAERRVRQP